MKVGKAGKAGPHAAYIAREGQYAERLGHGEKLESVEAGNMPAWAEKDAQYFWQAADAYERKNGTTYREMEIALPRELEPEQRAELVRDFVRQEIGDLHAYQWAIHTPKAADGLDQPHVHLMFSERQRDGIKRDPEQYFKRYNAKDPERGGAKKGYGPDAGQTLSAAERADNLKELRGRWQDTANEHLERAGFDERIDMRSHAERGTGQQSEAKQLPSQWRGQGRENVIEFRQAQRELAAAIDLVRQVVPHVDADIFQIDAEEKRRVRERLEASQIYADLRKEARDRVERQRIDYLSAAELAQEIARLRPESVSALVARNRDVQAAESEYVEIRHKHSEAGSRSAGARNDMAAWREKHPIQAWLHDKSPVGHASYLRECEQRKAEANQESLKLAPRVVDAEQRVRSARDAARLSIHIEQEPLLAKMAELEKVHQEKARKEREIENQRQAERDKKQKLYEMREEFVAMARKREIGQSDWRNRGEKWKAAPEKLRTLIDGYNAAPKQAQPVILERITSDTNRREQVRELLDEQKANYRENDRGMTR